jgi:hypothetical protein
MMKKPFIIMSFVVLLIFAIAICIYIYMNVPRKIKIYEEYQVYSKRETFGMFWHIIESEENRSFLAKDYEIDIPKIDFDKYFLLWSDGRKIKEIKYTIWSKYQWCFNDPKGVEIFDEMHYHHTAFFYKIERVYVLQD